MVKLPCFFFRTEKGRNLQQRLFKILVIFRLPRWVSFLSLTKVDLHFKKTFVDKNILLLIFSYNTKADKLSAIRANFTLAYTCDDSLNTDI